MTLKDILNADMKTVGQWLATGWQWWTRELRDMVPARWHHYISKRQQHVALLRPDGTIILQRHGKEIDLPANGKLPVILALPQQQLLVRDVTLPKLSQKDLRALILLEMDRLTPFQAADLLTDVAVLPKAAQPGQQWVRLLAVPRSVAERAMQDAQRRGLVPTALTRWTGDAADPEFNLLKHSTGASQAELSGPQFWWLATAALLACNLIVAVVRDIDETSRLREQVELQTPVTRAAQGLQRRVVLEHQRRTILTSKRSAHSPLRLLTTLSAQLPAGAWIQKLVMNGNVVQITGYAAPSIDVVTIIRQIQIASTVENMATDAPATGSSSLPFDIRMTLRSERPS